MAAVEAGVAGIRINPGNIGGKDAVREVVEAASEHGTVIRVGVNSGSLQRDLREMEERDPAGALVESAVRSCALLEELGFTRIKVSAKSSSPLVTIAANRLLAERVPYPLHLGVTEAGTRWAGSIRSAVALGVLLAEGVGDTIRVSLTGDPGRGGEGGPRDPADPRIGSSGPAGHLVPHLRTDRGGIWRRWLWRWSAGLRSRAWIWRWPSWGASSTGRARPGRPISASPGERARGWSSRKGDR